MYWNELLRRSRAIWLSDPAYIPPGSAVSVFSRGACWMAAYLRPPGCAPEALRRLPFGRYGVMKYTLAAAAQGVAATVLFRVHPALSPLSLAVFYVAEVHFLFLFPLLIDGTPRPLRTSIGLPYRLGFASTLLTLLPIAGYMIIGLGDFRCPFHNWHIGCLAVLIWYRDASEIRK